MVSASRVVLFQHPASMSILGLVDILAIVPTLRYQRVQDECCFRQGQGIDVLELAQVQSSCSFLIAWRGGAWGVKFADLTLSMVLGPTVCVRVGGD